MRVLSAPSLCVVFLMYNAYGRQFFFCQSRTRYLKPVNIGYDIPVKFWTEKYGGLFYDDDGPSRIFFPKKFAQFGLIYMYIEP